MPSLYAATSREAAAFETIFHDTSARSRFKSVPLPLVENRAASILSTTRSLTLASLFAPDLMALKLRRDQLIDTPQSTYLQTARWARAIHSHVRTLDGLIWTSRRCDPACCILGFGDRLRESDFDVVERRDVANDAGLLLELRGYGRRGGITIVT